MTPWAILAMFASWLPAAATVPEPIRAAVEYVESRSDPLAVSSCGCVGLMQVCPRWAIVPQQELFDQDTNRMEGARILAYWHKRANGNWRKALAGYRCGNGGLKGKCGRKYAAHVLRLARR